MTTPPYLPYGTALSGSAATSWADAILADLGDPQTSANIQTLVDWFNSEGGGGQNNPLNTTLRTSGSSGSINSVGVQSYSTPAAGAAADAATISGGGYPGIVSALQSGQGFVGSTSKEIAAELGKWSDNGYFSVSGNGNTAGSGSAAAASNNSGTPANDTSFLGLNFNIFQPMITFFGDLTSADLWERAGLMILGVMLISIGVILLATGPLLSAVGIGARTARGTSAISRVFGGSSTNSGGPTDEEKADRQRRLDLAETNTEIGRQKVEVQMMRERRLAGSSRHNGPEPNPAPPHN